MLDYFKNNKNAISSTFIVCCTSQLEDDTPAVWDKVHNNSGGGGRERQVGKDIREIKWAMY